MLDPIVHLAPSQIEFVAAAEDRCDAVALAVDSLRGRDLAFDEQRLMAGCLIAVEQKLAAIHQVIASRLSHAADADEKPIARGGYGGDDQAEAEAGPPE